MCREREYSLVNQIFGAETATLLPTVFKPTTRLDTQNPPNGPPKQQFSYFSIKVCYFGNKMKKFT